MKKCYATAMLWTLSAALVPGSLFAQNDTIPRPQVETYVVGDARPPDGTGGPVVDLSLEDAISRAMESNLSIQSARLTPQIQEYALRAAQAAFRPTVSGTYGFTNATNQSTSQLDGGTTTETERQTFNTSLNQTLPWYGARFSAGFNNSRTESTSAFTTRNPSYNSSLSLSYTQPLLAGRRIDNQRAQVETQQIQAQITDLQVYSQIENVTAQVREAYWGLRAAIEQIEIQRRNLEQAQDLLQQNRISVDLGQITELQVAQTEAQVASAEQALLNAEIQWRNQEFTFKTLLLGGADDPLLYQTVNPTDLPDLGEPAVDIEGAVEAALRERADIQQQRRQQNISEVNLEVSRTNTLPDLSLTASYSVQGVGGNLFERDQLGGDPVLVRQGGYLDGLESIAQLDTPTWGLTLNASIPLGIDPADANLERARLQLRQAELDLQAQELTIVTQVTNAGLAVQNTFLQLEAARRSSEAAERSAQAELQRFEVGVATNFEVNAAQDALTEARLSELRAVINYVNAIAEFDRVQRVGGGGNF